MGTNNRTIRASWNEDSRGTVDCQGAGPRGDPNGARGDAGRRRGSWETRRRRQSKKENFCSISRSLAVDRRQEIFTSTTSRQHLVFLCSENAKTQKAVTRFFTPNERNWAPPKARPDPLSDQVPARHSARAPTKTVKRFRRDFYAVTRAR